MKIEVTKAQLEAIKNLADDISGMLGQGDPWPDRAWIKHIEDIDRMLKMNNLPPRNFK